MPEEAKSASRLARLSGIGIELVAAVVGFMFLGYWWDRHFATRPWGVLIGAVLGLVGGLYNVVRQSLVSVREATSGSKKSKGDGER